MAKTSEYQVMLLETDDQTPNTGQFFKMKLPKFSVGMLINIHGKTYKVRDGGAARAFEKLQEGHLHLIAVAVRYHKTNPKE